MAEDNAIETEVPKQAPPTARQDQKTPAAEETAKSMWDVVHYLTVQFPKLAVAAAFLVLAYFGITEILAQRDKAQAALNDALQQIETVRSNADSIRDKAYIMMQEAHEEKIAAITAQKDAEIAAAQKVQDTLHTTSERIQTLVSGQITSMEALEKLRESTATEMSQQLANLKTRRQEMEEELLKTREEAKLAELNFAVNQLRDTIITNDGSIFEKINLVFASLDVDDPESIRYIEKKIEQMSESDIQLSLLFALFKKLDNSIYLDQFQTIFLDSYEDLDEFWLSGFFGTYGEIDTATWYKLLAPVLVAIADPENEPINRFTMTQFFDGHPERWNTPVFYNDRIETTSDLWGALEFMMGLIINNENEDIPSYYFNSAISRIFLLEPSAYHALGYVLRDNPNFTRDQKEQFAENLESNAQNYPALLSEPNAELVAFWQALDYKNNSSSYDLLKTREIYINSNE
ncbi:MAG: hypothetical protein ABJL55_09290 [Roseibium sp.]